MSLPHRPKNPPLTRTALFVSGSGIPSAPTSTTPKSRAEGESTNPPYQRKHRRTPAVSVLGASLAERSSYRTTPPPPLPRIPSSYTPRRGDSSEERDIPRPLPRGPFGGERVSRNQLMRGGENIVPSSVGQGRSSTAGGAMRRSESSSFPSRPRPENINPSQGQLRGLTPSRLPRSSSTSWRPNGPSVLRPPVRGDIEKSPQRVTTTNITPFVTKMPRIEKQPHQESYLTPLPAEGTIISPEGGLVGRQGNANPAGDNTNTPHPQHRRTNDAVHIPRSSTEYRFRGATTLRSPLLATARRSSGRPEDAPPRLVTTHMAPFVVDMTPPRASPPSQSRTRPAVLTGVRHTSESSLMITQQQLLEPLGPPIPRSRTMSALTPLAALTPNPRQVREAQPASYWSGRFTALNDRFCNENMALTTSKRMPEDRRTRRIFILLENLCVTKEAKESLKNFQSVYLANHKYAHLSSRKDEEKDYHVSMIKRIIGHIKRRSGGAATAESLD